MWLNNNEEILMKPFVHLIRNAPKQTAILTWKSGTQIIASYDTAYESDNCLEDDDPNYEEFWACCVKVEKIIHLAENDNLNMSPEGCFYEITYHNIPDHYEPAYPQT